jgi:SAM-dependent methyltransferase
MIAAARRRLTGAEVSFQVTSFEDLDAADASFGLIISCAAFHWIDPEVAFHWIDPEVAFSTSARLLRPGAWLALLGT